MWADKKKIANSPRMIITAPQMESLVSALSVKQAEFLLGKFEELLNRLIADRLIVVEKSKFFLAIAGAVISLSLNRALDMKDPPMVIAFLVAQAIIMMGMAGVIAWKCYLPTAYVPPGLQPIDWLNDKHIEKDKPVELLIKLAWDIDERIERNILLLAGLTKSLRSWALAMFLSPIGAGLAAFVYIQFIRCG